MNLDEPMAAGKADDFIRLILQHQTGLFGHSGSALPNEEQAKKVAKSLAAFRAELIEQLKKQP